MKTFFRKRWYFFIPLIIAGIVAFGYLTMTLWNYLMPAIFNLPVINFWQAIGLFVLSRILFGFGSHHSGHRHHQWGGHFRDKLAKMTPEEREQFYQKWHSRCRPVFHKENSTEEQY